MSRETIEICDLCGRDLTYVHGESIHRGRFAQYFGWRGVLEEKWDVTICASCWSRLGSELKAARAAPPECEPEKRLREGKA